jgi:hypothetical protein
MFVSMNIKGITKKNEPAGKKTRNISDNMNTIGNTTNSIGKGIALDSGARNKVGKRKRKIDPSDRILTHRERFL